MVHTVTPKPSLSQAFGQALGGLAVNTYNKKQQQRMEEMQQSKLNNALQQAQDIWSNPNLSDQQKIIGLNQALSVLNPQVSKNIIDQLQNQQLMQQKEVAGQQFINQIFGKQQGNVDQNQNFSSPLQQSNISSQGQDNSSPQQQQIDISRPETWTNEQISQARSLLGQPGNAGIIGQMGDNEAKKRELENKNRTAKEKEYFKFNEPKLAEISKAERTLKLENARYNRLGELFKDQEKFPSTLLAGLFTKEGNLNDLAYSQLSPSAQEAVKLIIDMTSGIKDTYGSRVTNFDLQTYLRKLPSLLNTPEGKQRILRDLQTINQINQKYNQGIQEIFEEAGGSDKISFSEAERRFNKKYGKEVDTMLSEFVTPTQKNFKEIPDPSRFLGKKLKDDKTGEIFISDGKEWKPFKG